MKILSIASILPVPGIKSNDFVFQTYQDYHKLFPGDEIIMIKPLKIELNPVKLAKQLFSKKGTGPYKTHMIQGFPVMVLPFLSTWGYRNIHSIVSRSLYYFSRKKIADLFRKYHFDIIHAQYIIPDALLAYHLHTIYHIPYVVTTHNERFYFEHALSRKLSFRILKEASGVFPINHFNYTFYKNSGIKAELIPLGFHESFVRQQKTETPDTIKILTVCELIKLKNVDQVIKAVKILSAKYNIHYTVIGKGKQKEELVNLVSSLGLNETVTFIEFIPYESIADEICRHDIFIMPSFFETFGRVYFEAMAMGIPVICAKNSGIYGIFREYEEGISVDHEKVDDIVKALEYLITRPDERQKIGLGGKKLVEQYTWKGIAEKLHARYTAVVEDSEKRR